MYNFPALRMLDSGAIFRKDLKWAGSRWELNDRVCILSNSILTLSIYFHFSFPLGLFHCCPYNLHEDIAISYTPKIRNISINSCSNEEWSFEPSCGALKRKESDSNNYKSIHSLKLLINKLKCKVWLKGVNDLMINV